MPLYPEGTPSLLPLPPPGRTSKGDFPPVTSPGVSLAENVFAEAEETRLAEASGSYIWPNVGIT